MIVLVVSLGDVRQQSEQFIDTLHQGLSVHSVQIPSRPAQPITVQAHSPGRQQHEEQQGRGGQQQVVREGSG